MMHMEAFATKWAGIADMLGRSISSAKRLYYRHGLPVVKECGVPTLLWSDYLKWRKTKIGDTKDEKDTKKD